MIAKSDFVSVINLMESQYRRDLNFCSGVSILFECVDVSMYNNYDLINALKTLLRYWFPVGEDGFCEIEHYCYVLDFGKSGKEDNMVYESPEEFYDRLVSRYKE